MTYALGALGGAGAFVAMSMGCQYPSSHKVRFELKTTFQKKPPGG